MGKIFNRNEPKEEDKDAVVLMEVAGKNVDLMVTFVKDQMVTVNKKKRPLPDDSYYLTSIKKVYKKLKLDKPVRLFILNRDQPENLSLTGHEVKYTSDTQDLLIDNNLFTAMMRGLTVSRMQMLLYGSFGIVVFEMLKGILRVLVEVLN